MRHNVRRGGAEKSLTGKPSQRVRCTTLRLVIIRVGGDLEIQDKGMYEGETNNKRTKDTHT
jgi:hypothetical protein